MTWELVIKAFQDLGLPITFLFVVIFFYVLAQKQSAERDRSNAKLHKDNSMLHSEHVKILTQQSQILAQLQVSIQKDHADIRVDINKGVNDIQSIISSTKTSIEAGINEVKDAMLKTKNDIQSSIDNNQQITMKHFDRLIKELEALPDLLKADYKLFDEKTQKGLQSMSEELKRLFELIREGYNNEKGAIDINPAITSPDD